MVYRNLKLQDHNKFLMRFIKVLLLLYAPVRQSPGMMYYSRRKHTHDLPFSIHFFQEANSNIFHEHISFRIDP